MANKLSTRGFAPLTVEQLYDMGFDQSRKDEEHIKVGCSQCEALVINGTPCHETGCPNAKHECAGCNELLPRNVKYCEDCRP